MIGAGLLSFRLHENDLADDGGDSDFGGNSVTARIEAV